MRIPFISFLIVSLIYGCKSIVAPFEHEILDEYFVINYNSWKYINSISDDRIYQYQVGDTIVLKSNIELLAYSELTTDTMKLTEEDLMEFEKSSPLVLTKSYESAFFNHSFQFLSLKNPMVKGFITTDQLILAQEGYKSLIVDKNFLLDKVDRQRKYYYQYIDSLARQHNMTVDSLHRVLAKQYYQVTKLPLFSH